LIEKLEKENLNTIANIIFNDWINRNDYFKDIENNQFYNIKSIIDDLFKKSWENDTQSVYRRKVINGQGPNYMEYSFDRLIKEAWGDTLSQIKRINSNY
jgi:protoporphyrinogen oxidase